MTNNKVIMLLIGIVFLVDFSESYGKDNYETYQEFYNNVLKNNLSDEDINSLLVENGNPASEVLLGKYIYDFSRAKWLLDVGYAIGDTPKDQEVFIKFNFKKGVSYLYFGKAKIEKNLNIKFKGKYSYISQIIHMRINEEGNDVDTLAKSMLLASSLHRQVMDCINNSDKKIDNNINYYKKELDKTYNDAQKLAKGDTKEALKESQHNWEKNLKDIYANNLVTNTKCSNIEAYIAVVHNRIFMLSKFIEQLKNPANPISVEGKIIYTHTNAGGAYGIEVDGLAHFIIIPEGDIVNKLNQLVDTDQIITFSGYLIDDTYFDFEREMSIIVK